MSKYEVTLANGIKVPALASDPVTGLIAGQIYYNTTTNKFRIYDGTSFADVSTGGGTQLSNIPVGSDITGWTVFGGGTFAIFSTGNILDRGHSNGTGSWRRQVVVPQDFSSFPANAFKIQTAKDNAPTNLFATVHINGVLDATISSLVITASVGGKVFQDKQSSFGSSVSAGDILTITIDSVSGSLIDINYIRKLQIQYNRN